MKIGLHVSAAGGVINAPANAAAYGAETFQLFTRSPRGGKAPAITDQVAADFRTSMEQHNFTTCYVHTPYYINFASANNRIRYGSISIVREELERSSKLGVTALMTHLGSGKDNSEAAASQKMVVESLLKTLDGYTGTTRFLIEIAAGSGLILGSRFEEIAFYIEQLETKNKKLKTRLGVCLDTCHLFSVGYDLRDPKSVAATLKKFDQTIGLDRLGVIHCNDSMTELNAHRDRHAHIGKGKIGEAGFKALVAAKPLKNVDLILETKHDGGEVEDLELLKKLRG